MREPDFDSRISKILPHLCRFGGSPVPFR